MNAKTRKSLEAAGFTVTADPYDWLGLSAEDRAWVELRLSAARAIRAARERAGLSQAALAAKIGSSQSRVAKAEAGAADVSLDLMFRGLFAAGGSVADVAAMHTKRRKPARTR